MEDLDISFEFFPPKTTDGENTLHQTARILDAQDPAYFSVTFGAGGTTREGTKATVFDLLDRVKHPVVPHISCTGSRCSALRTLLDEYRSYGINRLVVLRGDKPADGEAQQSELCYANELVQFIRDETGDYFHIEVAAYPECHPESATLQRELGYFRQKIDAGANGAITQFFYEADAYYYFRDACDKAGINIPIVPGIMPIVNFSRLKSFADNCGAQIPLWLTKKMADFGDDSQAMHDFGVEMVTHLCEQLIRYDVPGLHFYTMNRSEPTMTILKNLQLQKITEEAPCVS